MGYKQQKWYFLAVGEEIVPSERDGVRGVKQPDWAVPWVFLPHERRLYPNIT